MKRVFALLPILLAIILFSCKQEGASYTPYIQVSYFYLNPKYNGDSIEGAQDTLTYHMVDDYYVLDTISVTDTVVFAALFGSLGNELVAVRVQFDSTQLNFGTKLPANVKTCLNSSDEKMLQFTVNPGYNGVVLPLGYRPKTSGTHKFSMIVESDSRFSPSQVTFYQPVR